MASDQEYEFMGPTLGPIGIMVGLPFVCYGLVYVCNSEGCLGIRSLFVPGFPADSQLISTDAFLAILGWMAFQTILHLALPGQYVEGVVLPDKRRLRYKLNGGLAGMSCYIKQQCFVFGASMTCLLQLRRTWVPLSWQLSPSAFTSRSSG